MPPRRIPPPQHDPSPALAPPLDGLAALQGVVRQGVQRRQQSAAVPAAVEARLEAKVEALLHDTVIPHVGNQAQVYEWMERAQRPFDTPEEEEAFYRHVREASGSDEMVFMLRWGLMDTRDGDGATADALVRNLFAAPAGPGGGAGTLLGSLLGAGNSGDGADTLLRNLLGGAARSVSGAGAPRKTLQ